MTSWAELKRKRVREQRALADSGKAPRPTKRQIIIAVAASALATVAGAVVWVLAQIAALRKLFGGNGAKTA